MKSTFHGPFAVVLRSLGNAASMPTLRAIDVAVVAAAVVSAVGCSSASPSTAAAPAITTQPMPATVADGAVASFLVSATGDAPLAYQWRRNGVDLADGPGISGAASDTLALTASSAIDASQLSVRVSNAAGVVLSNDALLTVTAGPPSMMPDGGPPVIDPGGTWGPAVEISNVAFSNLRGSPQIALDDSGNATAVWLEELADNTRNAIWASRYAGGGWSTPATMDNAVGSSSTPQIAMTASGTALVAFTQSATNQGGSTLLVTNRFSGAWGTPATVPTTTPDTPVVAIGPDGAGAIVFTASDGTIPRAWAARSSTTGTWDTPAVMASSALPGVAPAVVVAANGDTVMTWSETDGGPTASIWARRNHAGVWSTPAQLTTDTGVVLGSIVVGADADGNVLAIWAQRMAGVYTLRSARMTASTGAWSAPVTVNDGTHEVSAPHLGVDAAGDAAAVWFETDVGVMASRFASSTAKWGSPVVVQAKSSGLVAYPIPSVGIDAKGNATTTWVAPVGSPPHPHLFAARSSAGGTTWTAPQDLLADPNGTPYAAETQLSVNAKGNAIVVWHEDASMTSTPGIWARVYR